MIVRRLEEIKGTPDEVGLGNRLSRRFVLGRRGMGHSVHETIFRAGESQRVQCRNHLESVYCIEHILHAHTDLRLVCVFTPAHVSPKVHDEFGS
ncbi:ectoine synthase [Aquisalimonas sp.]|uniref:ectoine synthase n=1 Tax=Aquisalimonas sp. TaxID=1872621 RepID=UPI0025C402E9|nr:ectoine synthase [Aquisalimonas sp.]